MNVEVRRMETTAEKAAGEQFAARAGALPGASWVGEMRKAAIGRFVEAGLPHRRIEEWKYTDLRAAMRELPAPAMPAESPQIEPETLAGVDAYRIVVVDGGAPRIAADLDSLDVVEVTALETALARDDETFRDLMSAWPEGADSAVLDLNTAFMNSGVVVRVKTGTRLDKPIHLAFVTSAPDAVAVYLRNVVLLEEGASAVVVESYEGPDGVAYQVNTATRFVVARGATLTHVKIQRDGDAAMHLATLGGETDGGSTLTLAPFTSGAALSRTNLALRFDGEEATAKVAGVNLFGGRQHGDMTLFVDHKAPACASRELFKAVLDGRARSVFQGKIVVRPHAQKTDGKMMSQALMLSDRAEADTKPELEIYADDVACGHGATTGRIDEDLLFYLRARGLPEPQAQALLIEAFIGEAVEAVGDEGLQEALTAYGHEWVAARRDTVE